MRCTGLTRLGLAAAGLGLLTAGAMGQDAYPPLLEKGAVQDDPGMSGGDVVSGPVGRTDLCNGVAVSFTATLLRAELDDVPGNRHAFFRAENFSTAAAGDLQLTTVTWWGTYTANTLPGSETFRIRLMADTGAGAPDVTLQLANESASTGAGVTRAATTKLAGTSTIYRYTYTLITPVTLLPNTCYWIEIGQADNLPFRPGITPPAAHVWNWATDNTDGHYHLTDDENVYGNFSEFIRAFDPAVCLDVDQQPNLCPRAVSDTPCVQDPELPGPECSGPPNRGQINFSNSGGFTLAEDFEVAGTGTQSLTSICWQGDYARTGPLAFALVPAPTDFFSIAIYNNNDGSPGTVIAELDQGFDFTLTRGFDVAVGANEYTATLLTPIDLTGGTCYWISIINTLGDPTLLWGWYPSLGGNNVNHRADATASANWPLAFNSTTRFEDIDFNFCMSFAVTPFGGCPPPMCVPPLEDACSSAIALTIGAPAVTGSNFCATRDPFVAEPCGFVNMGFPDVWYRVTNGAAEADLTVSTDFPATVIDSRLSVYCVDSMGTACFGEALNCVASNDDISGTNFSSTVTWTAAANATYYIRVDGFDVGAFGIGVTTAVSTPPVAACSNCELAGPPMVLPPGSVVEAEGCGSSSNGSVPAAEAGPSIDGGTWYGTAWADMNGRDFDYFSFTVPQTADVRMTFRSEFPLLMNLLNSAGGFLAGFFVASSCDGVDLDFIALPPGDYFVVYLHASGGVSTPNNFFGAPCGTHDEVEITLQDLRGACCLGDGSCVEALSEDDCTVTFGGTYQGLGTDCGSVMCTTPVCPCEFDGIPGVNVFDLLAFLDLWFVNAPGADIDGVMGVDVFDLLFFLDCWFPASGGAPCP